MSGLEHYDNEIYAIERRISRMAMVCGIDLSDESHVHAVRNGDFSPCANGSEENHRLLQELLQLLDYITMHCVNENGVVECQKIIEDVESRMKKAFWATEQAL